MKWSGCRWVDPSSGESSYQCAVANSSERRSGGVASLLPLLRYVSLALKIEHQDPYAGQLARTLMAQMRYDEAADAFRLASSEDPRNLDWWFGLADCLLRQEKHTEAIQALVAATEAHPDIAAIHNKIGCLEKHPRLAEDAFAAAVGVDPECALYRANLAVSQFRQWRFDEAEAAMRKAIRLQPGELRYAIDLGHMLMTLERYSGARSIFRRAATSQRHDAMLAGRAWKLYEQQRFDKARALFSHRSRTPHDKELAWAYQGFGLALRKLGENRPAIIAFRAAVSLHPDQAIFHRNLGDALSIANRPQQAGAAFEQARQLASETTDTQQGWTIELRSAWPITETAATR